MTSGVVVFFHGKTFQDTIKIDPTNSKIYENLGYIFKYLGEPREADYYFSKYI